MVERIVRRVFVTGLVQGVGFRWHMCEAARQAGVSGWVRNLQDGRVEALVAGPPAAVAAMLHWAGQGPAGARVAALTVEVPGEGVLADLPENFCQIATL